MPLHSRPNICGIRDMSGWAFPGQTRWLGSLPVEQNRADFVVGNLMLEERQCFGIPVARAPVYETPALKQQFLPEILRRYEAKFYAKPKSFETDRVHTSFGAPPATQVINPIPAPYEQLIRNFVSAERFQTQIYHSVYWSGGEYREQHHNLPSHISIRHFLAFDRNDHKFPIFYDPASLAKAHCHIGPIQPEVWTGESAFEVFEGDALVFPSYLLHSISPGTYGKPMVIVSLDVTLL